MHVLHITRITILAAAVVTLLSAHALANDDPQSCASIMDDDRRLECFDLLFRKSVASPTTNSKWDVEIETSKIDDSKNVFLFVDSIEPVRNRYGSSVRSKLTLRCRENVTSLSIWFGGHFMSDTESHGDVTYRIDTETAQTKRFRESTNHKHLGLWSGPSAIPFIKDIFDHEVLLVRATPFSESSVTMEFPIAGIESEITPLRKACGW